MAEADVNSSDKESDSKSSLELEIRSDGGICLFMFKPQHWTPSEEVDSYKAQINQKWWNLMHNRVLSIGTCVSALIAKLCPWKLKVSVVKK